MPTSSPPQRCALVTGAARGIGRATVEALAARGWRVVAGVRDPDHVEPFGSPVVHVVHLDVTDAESVRSGVAAAEAAAGGGLACVVNNAGWALVGAIEDVDLDVARREFETNFFGAVAVLQAALPGMLRAGGGVVVSVSTLSGRVPVPLFGMYSATKLSLAAVSEALALELAPAGVRVVLIEAGIVGTDLARSTVISGSAQSPESKYGPLRDAVLGALRGIRQSAPIAAEELADTIVTAVDNPASPFRIVLPGEGLGPLADIVGGPSDESHRAVREFLGRLGQHQPSDG